MFAGLRVNFPWCFPGWTVDEGDPMPSGGIERSSSSTLRATFPKSTPGNDAVKAIPA
jgi:hypothetical protein